ncbi:uncharacterized protein LOC141534828 [Cotesia typhae]|uniref:uncharacterized protein LOC141534828 n=1 Tax=Cotesia typhae TaxID=2053667 RepID=UPI003D698E11
MSVSEFLKNAPYAIVVFDEHDDFDKKLIDLVPTSWIIIDDNDEECLCQYPPIEIARTQLTKWLKELKKPDENWTNHQVEVKLRAHDYKQGLRRLQRAFTTAQAASESEDSYKPMLRCKMVLEEIQAILNESSSLNNGSIVAKENCN